MNPANASERWESIAVGFLTAATVLAGATTVGGLEAAVRFRTGGEYGANQAMRHALLAFFSIAALSYVFAWGRRQLGDDSNIHRTSHLRVEQGVVESIWLMLIEGCGWLESCEYPSLVQELCCTFKFLGPEIVCLRLLASGRLTREECASSSLSRALATQ